MYLFVHKLFVTQRLKNSQVAKILLYTREIHISQYTNNIVDMGDQSYVFNTRNSAVKYFVF